MCRELQRKYGGDPETASGQSDRQGADTAVHTPRSGAALGSTPSGLATAASIGGRPLRNMHLNKKPSGRICAVWLDGGTHCQLVSESGSIPLAYQSAQVLGALPFITEKNQRRVSVRHTEESAWCAPDLTMQPWSERARWLTGGVAMLLVRYSTRSFHQLMPS